jgi:UDP-glucuronate 4-epimerase
MSSLPIAFVTGCAGFVGHAMCRRLLSEGWQVLGVDNLNHYYSPAFKKARLQDLAEHESAQHFSFGHIDLIDKSALEAFILPKKPNVIIHLAAQAGVRYGLVNQVSYLESNLIGHFHILQLAKSLADAGSPIQHLLYASSSSVYGNNGAEKMGEPFRETDDVSRPVSLYAATKCADELITHAWAHQFGMPSTGLRFFTVYGPWGRPDMTPLMFTHSLYQGKSIKLFNGGDLWRDFTYIDDIIEAIYRLIPKIPAATPTSHTVYNLGNQQPVQMKEFVEILAKVTGQAPMVEHAPWLPTEVYRTAADTDKLKNAIGWAPSTDLQDGLAQLNHWYLQYRTIIDNAI